MSATTTLKLVVAGHTNVGKTSLLRTLGRSSGFGEVAATPSTTQQIQPLQLVRTADLEVIVFDTPGLERATRLREQLEDALRQRHDRPTVVRELVADPSAQALFAQELMVLEQVLQADACLVVLDAREPVLEKYLDEIDLLAQCGRPLLPVLNFVAQGDSRETEWQRALADLGQHLVVSLDAVVYDWHSEARLYRTLATVLPDAGPALQELLELRAQATDWRLKSAAQSLADTLIDVAAAELQAPSDDQAAIAKATADLQRYVTDSEQRLSQAILEAFNYAPEILGERLHEDYSDQGQWRRDLFSEGTASYYGIRALGPVGAGAATGSTVDLLSGGTLLGAGTALGALTGGALGLRRGLRRLQREWLGRRTTIAVSEAVLRLVATRNLQLILTLQRRGHGATDRLDQPAADSLRWRERLPGPVRDAQHHPEWSALAGSESGRDSAREQAVETLAARLQRTLERAQTPAEDDQRWHWGQ